MRKAFTTFLVVSAISVATQAGAQTPPLVEPEALVIREAPAVQQPTTPGLDAREIRSQFREVLNQYPSTLQDVLRIDPALMTDGAYLAYYPVLASFLAQYPEVAHNPSYFVGTPRSGGGNIMEPLMAMVIVSAIVLGLIWLIRALIDHRRWNRQTAVQSEFHGKLLDRFTANQDLLTYIDTPAGRHFLESTPIQLEGGASPTGAPISRILFSVQAGLVLGFGGLGLNFAIPRITDQDAADPLYVIGVLGIALGLGFILSALAALLLSRSLGLIDKPGVSSADVDA